MTIALRTVEYSAALGPPKSIRRRRFPLSLPAGSFTMFGRLTLGLLVALFPLASIARGADSMTPVSARFAAAEAQPSFQKHVLPLMSKVGCSGRACHGSFQGQGGFRLSLFGYDFKQDREALLGG